MPVTVSNGGGMPGPVNVYRLEQRFPVDKENLVASVTAFRPFNSGLQEAMRARNFSESDIFGMSMIMGELVPDIVSYCEGRGGGERPDFLARAEVDSAQARVEFRWHQGRGIDLVELARKRGEEIERLSQDTEAFEKSLQARIVQKQGEGVLGGPGLGLHLVLHFASEFHSRYDPANQEMSAIAIKRRTA